MELLILPFIGVLFLIRKDTSFLKNRYYLLLGIASVAWWIFLIVNMLNTHLNCTPDDAFCNSGNTVFGDVTWGTMIAFYTLLLVWTPSLLIGYIVHKQKSKSKK